MSDPRELMSFFMFCFRKKKQNKEKQPKKVHHCTVNYDSKIMSEPQELELFFPLCFGEKNRQKKKEQQKTTNESWSPHHYLRV